MPTTTGTTASDTLTGTPGDDVIDGLGGNDTIYGGDGSDTIYGGDGYDVIRGEGGDDFLYGGADGDYILDGAGNDHVEGGEGNDSFYSDQGNDLIDGGAGDDSFQVERRSTGDSVTLLGGAGGDRFDLLQIGTGGLTVDAGDGDDDISLRSNDGHYALTLGAGRDILRLAGQSVYSPQGGVVVADFETGAGGDRIDLSAILTYGVTGWNSDLSPFATGHLRLLQSGSNVLLQIDANGGGDAYVTVVTFSDSNAAAFTFENLDGFSPDGTIPAGQAFDGTDVADQLIGTAGDDTIDGLGGSDTIWGGTGADHLSGGAGDDQLYGEWGNDTIDGGSGQDYIVTGNGNDVVHGGDGSDFISSVGTGSATLDGDGDDDSINIQRWYETFAQTVVARGGAGNDSLTVNAYGPSNVFLLDGGTGDDVVTIGWLQGTADVTLGDGSDTIAFTDSQQVLRDYGSVIVRDFQAGAGGDKLDMDGWLVSALTGWDQSSNPFGNGYLRLVQSGSDVLFQLDRDGPGGGAAFRTIVTFKNADASTFVPANLDGFAPDGSAPPGVTIIGTSASETLVGTSGADHIESGGGYDTLRGEGGNDILIGGASRSSIYGGSGNDTLYAGDAGDGLNGDGGDDVVHGGAGADTINIGFGTDIAYGAGGGDTFYLYANPGTSVASAYGEAGNDFFDLHSYYVATFSADGGEGDDRFNVGGVSGTTTLILGAGRDSIGFDGDRFNNAAGILLVTDFVAGEAGDTLLLPASLGKLLTGWSGTDNPFETGYVRLVQSGADTIVTIDQDGGANWFVPLVTLQNLHATTLTAANLGYDPGFVYGTNANDLLDGTGGPDRLAGSAGDQLRGGLGDDIYLVESPSATVTELAGEGIDTVWTALGTIASIFGLPANVENLVGTSAAGQTVAGNALDNLMTMGAGNDVLDLSSGGNDTASGGGGNDYFYFGAAFTAADTIVGGAGVDTVALLGSYNLTLGANTLSGVETFSLLSGTAAGGTQHVTYSITTVDENVPAGGRLTVYAGGLLADESLFFNGYAETDGALSVYGGAGNDTFAGGPANDAFVGGAGDDTMYGLGGMDWLEGGLGADTMRGGPGNDLFVYKSAAESTAAKTDHILDFEYVSDHFSLTAIDANTNLAGDQAFTFIGSDPFSNTAGELRAYQSGASWFIEGDVDGDGTADLVIQVDTFGHALGASDFLL
ncbi:MAG TPA: calcium-binding protein [Allosphingosinicella sp.]|jgi:Ca2+-binding RTX toxin-like protein